MAGYTNVVTASGVVGGEWIPNSWINWFVHWPQERGSKEWVIAILFYWIRFIRFVKNNIKSYLSDTPSI